MEMWKGYWKQFVVWVTDLKHKFLHDPFLKSEINVIVVQLSFALSLFIISSIFFNYIYHATFVIFSAIFIGLTTVFTFLVAKITLRPAKSALQSQKRFISDIAHELRTPLSIIKTNSEVALMDEDLDQSMKNVMESNVEELNRMSDIINNLLSLKNLVQPERVKFIDVGLAPIIDSCLHKLKHLIKKKDLQITTKKLSPNIVWGNPVALEQIVNNLLKNAVSYTPPGGRITIQIGPDYMGNVLLHIEDTGVGIAKKDLLHIFEPFYRAERSRNRKHGSSGLGLTIVSELIKMHSGKLSVKSAENKGTTAIVTLPTNLKSTLEENIIAPYLNEVSVNFLGKSRSS